MGDAEVAELSRRLVGLVTLTAENGGEPDAVTAVAAGYSPDEPVDVALALGARLAWVWIESSAQLSGFPPGELWRTYTSQTAEHREGY